MNKRSRKGGNAPTQPVRVGITGTFGSGKTTVAGMFKELGAAVIDADILARKVIAKGTSGRNDVIKAFGKSIMSRDGRLLRKKLASIVFTNPDRLKTLNAIIHPRVRKEMQKLIERYNSTKDMIALDIPLLYENTREGCVDCVVVVVIDQQVRERRLMRKRGMSRADISQRLRCQMSQEEKVKKADFIIHNSGSLERTREQVKNTMKQIHTTIKDGMK